MAWMAREFGQAAVEAAAEAIRAGGAIPLPGRVLGELQRLASEALAQQQIVQAERGARSSKLRREKLEAESRRRGDQEIAELLAMQEQERDA